MFDRIISIDWSGADTEDERVALRIAQFDVGTRAFSIVDPQNCRRGVRGWSRRECREWLVTQLNGDRRTLVAMDFGFGFPWGSDNAVFGCLGWRKMVAEIASVYSRCGTARQSGTAINNQPHLAGHGPYRFNESRTDFRFYLDHGVAYYRLTELAAPQAISQWYLGSGGTVGFHTITGLAAIDDLLQRRDRGEIQFHVWPHEGLKPEKLTNVLVESYPAICKKPDDYGPCVDDDQRDAWKVLKFLVDAMTHSRLDDLFRIEAQPFGRVDGVGFYDQIRFEGYIIGLQ